MCHKLGEKGSLMGLRQLLAPSGKRGWLQVQEAQHSMRNILCPTKRSDILRSSSRRGKIQQFCGTASLGSSGVPALLHCGPCLLHLTSSQLLKSSKNHKPFAACSCCNQHPLVYLILFSPLLRGGFEQALSTVKSH